MTNTPTTSWNLRTFPHLFDTAEKIAEELDNEARRIAEDEARLVRYYRNLGRR